MNIDGGAILVVMTIAANFEGGLLKRSLEEIFTYLHNQFEVTVASKINSSLLHGKIEKEYSCHATSMKFTWSKKFQSYLKS